MSRWVWEASTRRYRDTSSGRFVGERRALELRDRYVSHRATQMRAFVDGALGDLTPGGDGWGAGVSRVNRLGWRRIENTIITEYAYGRGGIHAMTAADRAVLQGILNEQRAYWRNMIGEARSGELSVRQIGARAEMYHHASTGAYERGRAAAWGIVLPAYPGDGGTECLSYCKCHWSYRDGADGTVEAYWTPTGNPCPGCSQNASAWAPYIARPGA